MSRALKPIIPLCLASLFATAFLGCSHDASDYPTRPIAIICPWAVGGGTDTCSRLLAATLEEATSVPVNVINRVGGAGVTGHAAGAQAARDGYTILTITTEISMMHWRGLTDVSYEDYAPICLFNRDQSAIFVRSDSPWKTLEDLRQHIEANPGSLRASGTALGGIWHLGWAGALIAMGLTPEHVVWVPSTGAAPARQELISGGIEIVCCSLPEARGLLEGGKVRALGVMANERLAQFPNVPTLREQGHDWMLGGWRGLALPKGTPPEIASRVEKIVGSVARGEEFQARLREAGFGVAFEDSKTFAATLEREDRILGQLLEKSMGKRVSDGAPGPWFFPTVLGIGLGLVGLAIGLGRRSSTIKPRPRGAKTPPGSWTHFVAVLGSVILYVFFAPRLGFIITAALIVFFLSKRLGARWLSAAMVAAVVSPAIYFLFAKILRVPLPEGIFVW